jgi:hypothetical protein
MVLIAYHLLESSLGAYIEWSVMLLADEINPQARKPCIIPEVFFFLLTGKSCGVQLSTQGLFYPVAGDKC